MSFLKKHWIIIASVISTLFLFLTVQLFFGATWFLPVEDPGKADPLKALPGMAEFAFENGGQLHSLKIHKLKPDGTVDLTDGEYREVKVEAEFVMPVTPGASLDDQKEPKCTVWLRDSWTLDPGDAAGGGGLDLGMSKLCGPVSAPCQVAVIPLPECSLSDLWKKAVPFGAPDDGRADVRWDGKEYAFVIYSHGARKPYTIQFGPDCQPTERFLKSHESMKRVEAEKAWHRAQRKKK